jgi:glycerol-3-phosphate acyltransferase PlsY
LAVLALLVIGRHAKNLRRLVRGEELELPRTPVPGQEDEAS